MEVSYRKGFWRLWIMVSILWIVFCLWFYGSKAKEDIKKLPDKQTFRRAYIVEYQELLGVPQEITYAIHKDQIRRGRRPDIIFNISEEYKSQELPWLTPEILDQSPLTVIYHTDIRHFPEGTEAEEIWDEYKSIIHLDYWRIGFKLFGLLIIPPIFLLLLGQTLFWVVQGFISIDKSKSEKTTSKKYEIGEQAIPRSNKNIHERDSPKPSKKIIHSKPLKESKTEQVFKAKGTGLITAGYILGLLGGLIGFFCGAVLVLSKNKASDGTKTFKYDKSSRTHGKIIMIISFFMMILWKTLTAEM